MKKLTQNEMILDMLEDEIGVTQLDALTHAGCMRLSARIGELKEDGYDISTAMISYNTTFGETKTIAEYWLI